MAYDYPEELTERMHSTFVVDKETEIKHRVWAAASMVYWNEYPLEDALRLSQVSLSDFEKYEKTWPVSPL